MNNESPFTVSQEYVISQPKSREAFPMAHDEWNYLKKKIYSISRNPGLVSHSFGISLLALAVGNLYTLFAQDSPLTLGTLQTPKTIICIAIFVMFVLAGVLLLLFARFRRKVQLDKAKDIVLHMNLIQNRYPCDETLNSP